MAHSRSPSMESSDPRHTSHDPAPESEPDVLRRLEERLDRASDAAERLITEAAQAAARAASESVKPPPAGWQSREPAGETSTGRGTHDADLLGQVLGAFRELIPPELQQRLAQALRELLLALRALLDWYIDRLERRRGQPIEVQDIPIQ